MEIAFFFPETDQDDGPSITVDGVPPPVGAKLFSGNTTMVAGSKPKFPGGEFEVTHISYGLRNRETLALAFGQTRVLTTYYAEVFLGPVTKG